LVNHAAKQSPQLRDILDKTRPRHEPEVEEATLKEARLAMPTPMLNVIFKSGKRRGFGYTYLTEVEFDPGDTVKIKFTTGAEIIVEGRGLERHYDQVRLHRADEIRECSDSELALQAEGIAQVERIIITEGEKA
jgi:hypothetical protein